MKANLKASGLKLSDEEVDRLDRLSAIQPDYASSIVGDGRKASQQYF